MRFVNFFQIMNLICSAGIILYILIDVGYKKSQLQKGTIDEIKSNKYIILISIIILLFFIYGILRNFK